MASDLYLDDHSVVAKGHRFRVDGEDLELRSSARLGEDEQQAGLRRALVHSQRDSLIINYKGDYLETEVHGQLKVRVGDRSPPRIVVKDGRGGDGVSLLGPNGLVSCSDVRLDKLPYGGASGTDSLLKTIAWLHQRVRELEERLNVETPDFPTERRG